MITARTRCALTALPLGAVLLLGTACGGDDPADAAGAASSSSSSSSAASSSAASSSSAAPSSSASADDLQDDFCRQAPMVLQQVSTDLGSVQQAPQEAPQRLAAAVDQLNQLQPPPGVAPQWQRFVGAVTGMRDLVGKLDLSNPQANTGYADELEALRPGLIDGGSAIDDWGKANC
ncbi:hypothetical protein [Modestobacter sp. NPDC049651]|uniref:hypothetical protein n=1 Tax=unclassified Modestobacter TaxID=2643866 RepID=UPI0033C45852